MQLTIVGLGVVGTSLGMALKATNADILIMGHDPEAENVKRAKKLGAIDKSHWNLIGACERADLLVFDLSLEEVEKTLAALQGYVKESAVIVDMAPVKKPVFEAAQRLLPQVPFIGGHVVSPRLLTADADPSADLVNGATFYIVAPEDVTPAALDTATNLAAAVGAKPQYIDVQEHDGLVAATLELPLLGALALMRAITESAGWRDRVKSVGGELATVGAALVNAPPGMMDLVLSNREDVLRWLDLYAQQLDDLRQLIANQDAKSLSETLDASVRAYLEGLAHGEQTSPQADPPGSGSYLRSMFLGRLGDPRKKPDSGDKK